MRAPPVHQNVNEALMVMREAFRDQVEVAVNRDGNLVYVNPHLNSQDPACVPDLDNVRSTLAAKIENELAPACASIEELRRHIKTRLPSLSDVDFKTDNPAIPFLQCEWEELLKANDPVACAEFVSTKKVMARREKLVDFLRKSLPPAGGLTPLEDNLYQITLLPSTKQQNQMLQKFMTNANRGINTSLNITQQLVKDSHRANDLHLLMPSSASERRIVVHLKNAPADQTAEALRKFTEQRHTHQTAKNELPSDRLPQDRQDQSDKNFMQVLSMMSDQTLMNCFDDLQNDMFGIEHMIFNGDGDARFRQLLTDSRGNPTLTFRSNRLSRSLIAPDISIDSLALKSPTRGEPVNDKNHTFSFKAGVVVDKSEAEQGKLSARFLGPPELSISFSLDWKKIDPVLAKAWP